MQFELLGHDAPLGYPAPVVPIGTLNGELVAVYAGDQAQLEKISTDTYYSVHSPILKQQLKDFDPYTERLFGIDNNRLEKYAAKNEKEVFARLLTDPTFSADNPFLRLSLAKETNSVRSIHRELFSCSKAIFQIQPAFTDRWYLQQRNDLLESHGHAIWLLIPNSWPKLASYLADDPPSTARGRSQLKVHDIPNIQVRTYKDWSNEVDKLYKLPHKDLIQAFFKEVVVFNPLSSPHHSALVQKCQKIAMKLMDSKLGRYPVSISKKDVSLEIASKLVNRLADQNPFEKSLMRSRTFTTLVSDFALTEVNHLLKVESQRRAITFDAKLFETLKKKKKGKDPYEARKVIFQQVFSSTLEQYFNDPEKVRKEMSEKKMERGRRLFICYAQGQTRTTTSRALGISPEKVDDELELLQESLSRWLTTLK